MVSEKLGVVLLVLGVMHFLNIFIFTKIRNREKQTVPPPLENVGGERPPSLPEAPFPAVNKNKGVEDFL